MFTSIQKILPKAIGAIGIKREVEAALICEKYRKLAPAIIHEKALDHTFPKFYQRRTLTIGVENAAWAHCVIVKKDDLLKAINKALGKTYVTTLRTRVFSKVMPE